MTPRRRIRLRRAARFTFWAAGAFLVAFLLFLTVRLIAQDPSPETANRLDVAVAVSGILGGLATVATLALNVNKARRPRGKRESLLSPHLVEDDLLVDRADEMRDLVTRIGSERIVNCHGQRGAGKSFLLSHLTDVINGHRDPSRGHLVPRGISAALYFDLADAVGFEQLGTRVCRESLGRTEGSWDDFVEYAKDEFGSRRVLLVLDNVNTPGLWPALGTAVYRYLARRPTDKVVFGSIDPVVLDNLTVEPVSLSGLDPVAIEELVVARGGEPDRGFLDELHGQYDGLPFYVRLLTSYAGVLEGDRRTLAVDSVIDGQVIPELAPETRRLLSYASLFAVVTRQVSLGDLEQCPLANLEAEVDVARRLSLISPIPEVGQRQIRVHDLVRDAVLRGLDAEVSEAAALLFERAYEQERKIEAAFYLMFADPEEIGAKRFDEVFGYVVRESVASRNYAVLANLQERAKQSVRVMRFLAADRDRHDLFCFGCASELAALGHYPEAEEALHASSIVNARKGRQLQFDSELQPELRFLEADLIHLLTRFDEAAVMFEELGEWAGANDRGSLQARCTWAHAHVLRHQGRNLDRILELFEEAISLGEEFDVLFARAQSIAGASGIKIVTGSVPDDEEDRLTAIEAEIAASMSHDGYMLRIWKAQSRLAWYRGDRERAFEIVEAAISRALALNDRALYNLQFERGEFLRLGGQAEQAFGDYELALDFANGNGDRNLQANSLLGLVLADGTVGSWPRHGSAAAARAVALRARDLALEADVTMTVEVAERLVADLDGNLDPTAFRLIVF